MDYKYIEQLLERYWACETSPQEESILRNFFAQSDVPAHLQRYKQLFFCQEAMGNEVLSSDFDERILAKIERKGNGKEQHTVKARRMRMGYGLQPFFKAAAVVAVVLSFSLAVQQAMYRDQDQTPNAVTLPPAVVPGAPETAYGADQFCTDTLERIEDAQLIIRNAQ